MTVKISRSAVRKLKGSDEPLTAERASEIMASDARSVAQNELIEIDEGLLSTLKEVFGDTGLIEDEAKLRVLITQRKIIYRNFIKSGHASLAMGNALLNLDASLTEEQRERLKGSSDRILPFGDTVASMLRSVARFVQAGKVPEDQLPASYSAAYVLTSMTDTELEAARSNGLIRPEVGRPRLLKFRKEFRERANASEVEKGGVIDIEKLVSQRARLNSRRRKISSEYFQLSREVREISQVLTKLQKRAG